MNCVTLSKLFVTNRILWNPAVNEEKKSHFFYSKLTQLTNKLSNFIIKVWSEEAVASIVKSVMIEFTS